MHKIAFFTIIVILVVLLIWAWNRPHVQHEMSFDSESYKKRAMSKMLFDARFPKPDLTAKISREEKCRDIFEYLLQADFPSRRPDFLKNPSTKRNLELDGYNEKLKLAFEHNGKQHYEFPNTFHKTRDDFEKQIARDAFKNARCQELDIDLINIPYTVKTKDLEKFIKRELVKLGFSQQ